MLAPPLLACADDAHDERTGRWISPARRPGLYPARTAGPATRTTSSASNSHDASSSIRPTATLRLRTGSPGPSTSPPPHHRLRVRPPPVADELVDVVTAAASGAGTERPGLHGPRREPATAAIRARGRRHPARARRHPAHVRVARPQQRRHRRAQPPPQLAAALRLLAAHLSTSPPLHEHGKSRPGANKKSPWVTERDLEEWMLIPRSRMEGRRS